jgi:hypothetical protein
MIARGSIVVFDYARRGSAAIPRLFHVLDGPTEGLVRLDPLHPADNRPPFWDSVNQLIEVPHARLDEQGYVRIATNGSDDTAPTARERKAFVAGMEVGNTYTEGAVGPATIEKQWRDYLAVSRPMSTGGDPS